MISMHSVVVPVDAAVSPTTRQSLRRGSHDFWAVIRPMRGMRSCLFIGCALSVLWFSLNLMLMSKSQADSEIVNFTGRLRFLTQQMGVKLLAARFRPNFNIRGDGSNSLSQLDLISSALLGKSDMEGIPQISDDDAKRLLKQWRENLDFFHDLYQHADIAFLADEVLDQLVRKLDSLTHLADRIVDKISLEAANRVRLLLALNVCRVASAFLWGVLVMWLVGKVWRPYVDLYEREQYAIRVIDEQSIVIDEQRAENAEFQLGQLHELPGLGHIDSFVKHGARRIQSVAKRSFTSATPRSSVSAPPRSVESASASARSSLSASSRPLASGNGDEREEFDDDDFRKRDVGEGDVPSTPTSKDYDRSDLPSISASSSVSASSRPSASGNGNEREESDDEDFCETDDEEGDVPSTPTSKDYDRSETIYDLPSISECSAPIVHNCFDGKWQLRGQLLDANEARVSSKWHTLEIQHDLVVYGKTELTCLKRDKTHVYLDGKMLSLSDEFLYCDANSGNRIYFTRV